MKEQLIQEVQRQMLPYLNNAQLKQLQGVLEGVLSGVELSHSAGMVESAKVDTVACFINAKRIEGCSEIKNQSDANSGFRQCWSGSRCSGKVGN